jgi:hypothetical protein
MNQQAQEIIIYHNPMEKAMWDMIGTDPTSTATFVLVFVAIAIGGCIAYKRKVDKKNLADK